MRQAIREVERNDREHFLQEIPSEAGVGGSSSFKKSFRDIAIEGQYFIFASYSTVLSFYHVTIWVHGIPPKWYLSSNYTKMGIKLTGE